MYRVVQGGIGLYIDISHICFYDSMHFTWSPDYTSSFLTFLQTLYSHYIHTIYTLYSHYIHTIYTLYSHYIHTIYTLLGAIARTVRTIVTNRRIAMNKLRPLISSDFIDNLAQQVVNYQDDKAAFMDFTSTITGLTDRRKKVLAIISGDTGEKKDKKKK